MHISKSLFKKIYKAGTIKNHCVELMNMDYIPHPADIERQRREDEDRYDNRRGILRLPLSEEPASKPEYDPTERMDPRYRPKRGVVIIGPEGQEEYQN